MAIADIFKTRRSAKINRQAWALVWERVKAPPTGEVAERELHAVFVGTLLYATRYQAALASGMEERTARTVALQVVIQADFDESMRDRILSVFSAPSGEGSAGYAATLNPLIAAIVDRTKARGGSPEDEPVEGLLREVENLMPMLAERLSDEG